MVSLSAGFAAATFLQLSIPKGGGAPAAIGSPAISRTGTVAGNFAPASVMALQDPSASIATYALKRSGRAISVGYTVRPPCECARTTAGPIFSRSAISALEFGAGPFCALKNQSGTGGARH